MASTTKIMTAVVTLDTVPPHKLDEVFTVGTMRPRPGETVMGLRTGDRVTVRELLHGLLLSSGNDAADALAVRVAGSQQRFVQLMNTKRDLLGLRHTSYANPSGLDHPNHCTTARDLATLALHALQYPEFAKIVAQRTYQVGGGAGGRQLVNLNVPLFYYPGVTGVKPGWTPRAGVCQVVSVTLDGRSIVAVLLDTAPEAADMTRLLDWIYGTVSSPVPASYALSRVRGTGADGEPWTYFPATGRRVRAGFLRFFQRVGGVDVLGYPISEEFEEDRRVVQYFQRARLEWHPELAGTPYEVQVSLLGERLANKRGLLPQPAIEPFESWQWSRYFPETGHSVHSAFLRYFDRNGGADVLGYPLTEELPRDVDWPHAVQYFQRARLEYHPDRAGTPGEVTASLLGEWVWQRRLRQPVEPAVAAEPAPPPPPATAAPSPAPTVAPAPVATAAPEPTAPLPVQPGPASDGMPPAARPSGGAMRAGAGDGREGGARPSLLEFLRGFLRRAV
jgi:hypothetical protein